jgi:hypothetical protein
MRPSKKMRMLATAALLAATPLASALAQDATSFFVSSVGKGDGANLGGLEGADAHCQSLAEAAGVTGKTWRAYLSTSGDGSVNAKDRIGAGPWANAKGVEIAASVDELHTDPNKINKETALDEKGNTVKGRGDDPNQHDILTGTQQDGTAFAAGEDRTCSNWTSNGEGSAMVGHHDLIGNPQNINFWNFSHPSRGCSQENLVDTGGAGLFYCFAAE